MEFVMTVESPKVFLSPGTWFAIVSTEDRVAALFNTQQAADSHMMTYVTSPGWRVVKVLIP